MVEKATMQIGEQMIEDVYFVNNNFQFYYKQILTF